MNLKTGFLGVLIFAASVFSQENYSQWLYHKDVTVNTSASGANVATDQVNFPVLIRLTSANSDVFRLALPTGADIRFSKQDGTRLNYQIERWSAVASDASAAIWVLLDTVYGNNSSQSIRMYWGKVGVADSSKSASVFAPANNFQGAYHMTSATELDNAAPVSGTLDLKTPPTNPADLAPTVSTGNIGQGLVFNGVGTIGASSAATLNSSKSNAGFNFTTDRTAHYTLSAWAKNGATQAAALGMIVCKSAQYYLGIRNNSGTYQWEMAEYTTTNGTDRLAANTVTTADGWNHVVGVRDGATTTIYVNGVSAASTTFSGSSGGHNYLLADSGGSKPQTVGIGRDGGGAITDNGVSPTSSSYFKGSIDELHVENTSRGADWVKLSYETQKSGTTAVTLGATQTEDYTQWSASKAISVNTTSLNLSGMVINFPLLVRLTSSDAAVFNNALGTNAGDIRFTKADGITPLAYQRERWNATSQVAEFWVLMDTMKASDSTGIRIYWGKSGVPDGSNSQATFQTTNGFAGVWHMEGDSSNVSDATVNGFTGTKVGTVNDSSGNIGRGRYFTGTSNNFIRITHSGQGYSNTAKKGLLDSVMTSFTISAWFNASSWSGNPRLICRGNSGIKYSFQDTSSGLFYNVNTNTTLQPRTASAPSTGAWHLVHGTYNPTGTIVSYYVDGQFVGSVVKARATDNSPYDLVIGGRNTFSGDATTTNTADHVFNGILDEVRVQSTLRDSNWIKLEYATQRTGQTVVTGTAAPAAPSNLSYSANPAVYGQNVSITANSPTVTGSAGTYSITPDLNANTGLLFNTSTGVISGTPTKTSSATDYTVTASNNTGSTQATVNIQVNGFVYANTAVVYKKGAVITDNLLASSTGSYTGFSISPSIATNTGLSFNTSTGAITGTPTTASSTTTYTVTGTFSGGTTTATVNIRVEGEDYSQWNIYKTLSVNTSTLGLTGAVTNFPMLVRLASGDADVFGNALSINGGDIRFTKADGVTHLPYQRERWDAANKVAEFWVLMDTVKTGASTSIRMYCGKSGAADSSNGKAVFSTANNFVGVWHMEGDSSNVADATGAGFYGTNYGTTNTVGPIGIGRSFSRTSPTVGQFIRIFGSGNNAKFDLNMTQTTISLWVNGTDWGSSLTDRAKVICRGTSSFKYELLDTTFDGNSYGMWWGVNPTAGNNGSLVKTPGSLSTNAWHLIHGTFNPSANNISLYVDGAFVGSVAGSAAYALSPWDVHLGARGFGSSPGGTEDHFFNGMMDEVRMQGVSRNADWVALDYATQRADQTIVTGSGGTAQSAPSNLSYSSPTVGYTLGAVIVAKTPTVTGAVTAYSISPNLTANTGLSFDTLTGVISGTSTSASPATNYTVTASNSAGFTTTTINISVLGSPSNLSYASQNAMYAVGVAITSNNPSISGTATHYAVTPALPSGLVIDSLTGVISGTPSVGQILTQYVVTAGNDAGSTSDTITIRILSAPASITYNPATLLDTVGILMVPVSPVTTGDTVTLYSIAPALPTGLALNSGTGAISGTPMLVTSARNYTVTAANPAGSVTSTVNIAVNPGANQEDYRLWAHYRDITLNTTSSGGGANISGAVRKYPLLVRLDSGNGDVFSQTLASGGDIRFTKSDGATPLKYQREYWTVGSKAAALWVLMDTVYGNNSTQTFRMYWGNSNAADSSNASAVFDTANGFQGVWHLGEATNANATDATANNFSGTPGTTGTAGNPLDTSGVIGRAKVFHVTTFASNAGTAGAYYAMAGTASGKLNFAEQSIYTLSAWVRPYDITNSGKIVSKGDRKYYLAKRNGGASFEFAENQTGSGQNWWRVNSVANTWKYVVGVRIGGAGVAGGLEYVDGALATTSGTSNNQATNSGFDINIGRDPSQAGGAASYYFTGGIDEVTISNVARSADWVKLSFQTQKLGATVVTVGSSFTSPPLGISYTTPVVYHANAVISNNLPTTTGGAPTHYSIAPALPSGLMLDTLTGIISGTPTGVSTVTNYTVTASNGSGDPVTTMVNITVTEAAPSNLSYTNQSAVYALGTGIASNVPSVTGTNLHYGVNPVLPAGLNIDSATGIISGVPNTASTSASYVVTAANNGGSIRDTLHITVLAPPSGLSYAKISDTEFLAVGQELKPAAPTVTGTVSHYAVDSLPPGLHIDSATGVLSGTLTASHAAANYTVIATNFAGSASKTFNITVLTPPSNLSYVRDTTVYGVGISMTQNTPTVSGDVSHYAISPSLPTGLLLDSLTGVISGTPTAASSSAGYTVTASNASGSSTTHAIVIGVLAAPSGLSYAYQRPVYSVGTAIAPNTPTVTGTAIRYSANALPAGLSIDSTTGVISGIPGSVSVTTSYVVTANNVAGSTTGTLHITVLSPPTNLSYAQDTAVYGVNTTIASNVPSVNGTATHYMIAPALPAGLNLDSSTGVISGTPVSASPVANYTVTAGNASGASTTHGLNITILGAPANLAYTTNPAIYGVNVVITNNVPTVTGTVSHYSASSLPAGLNIDSVTGVISGTPTAVSAQTAYLVTASNVAGSDTETARFTVLAPPANLSYAVHASLYGTGTAIAPNIPTVTGTVQKFSVQPSLPAGLNMDTSTGVISGTPNTASASTDYVVTAGNAAGVARDTLHLTVMAPPSNFTYRYNVAAYQKSVLIIPDTPMVTGTVSHYAITPALSAGLAFDTVTGILSGVPLSSVPKTVYTVIASNLVGSAMDSLMITIFDSVPPPVISYKHNPVVYMKHVIIIPDTALSSGGPVTGYSVNPALPAGLSLNASTGVVSGTPASVTPSANYVVKATGQGGVDSIALNITVQDTAPAISYVRTAISGIKHVAVIPDTAISTGGPVTSYSVSPALPAGLVLDTLSGRISGIPTVVSISASYTVTATGPGGTGVFVVNITVADTAPAIAYKRATINGSKNIAMIPDTVVSTGGAISGYAVNPPLPAGLALNTLTGLISGIPTAVATAANYTVTATGPGGTGVAVMNISVVDLTPVISYPRVTISAIKGIAITPDTVVASGGVIDSFTVNPALPSGLFLSKTTGLLSGAPAVASVAVNYTVTARGPGGNGIFVVNIAVADSTPVIAYKRGTISGIKGMAIFADTIASTGGSVTHYTVTPLLPSGLVLDSVSGRISGTPNVPSSSAVYVVTGMGMGGSDTALVTIAIVDTAPRIAYKRLALVLTKNIGMIPDSVNSTGGAVTVYHVSPTLPSGLVLDSISGIISGVSTVQSNPVNYTVTATGQGGTGVSVLSISTYSVPSNLSYADDPVVYVLGIPISPNALSVTGLITHFSVNPALPAGLRLDSISGAISGTPTGTQHFASDYTVTAGNPVGSTTGTVNMAIVGPPSNLSYADDVPTYATNVEIIPPSAPTVQGIVTFYTVSPTLPTGIVFDQTTGYIQGTPTAISPSTNYTVTGQNPGGTTSTLINLSVITVP